jgi:purine-nucleoside phosphorylase
VNNLGIKIVFIYLIWAISACQSKSQKTDIDKETMSKIIAELQITENKVNRLAFNQGDSAKIAYSYLANKVFAKYKTDSAKFAKNFDLFADDKNQMLKIYENAEKILTERKDSLNLNNANEKPSHRPDVQ